MIEILQLTTIDQRNDVGTTDNRADDVTRKGSESRSRAFREPDFGKPLARKGTPTQHAVTWNEQESVLVDIFLTIELSKNPTKNFQFSVATVKCVSVCLARLPSALNG